MNPEENLFQSSISNINNDRVSVLCLGKLQRDTSFFLWRTHKLAFLEASLWKPSIKRVIPMLILARGVLLTWEQEKWTSSQGLWVFRVVLSTGAFWIQLFSQEAKAYCGHALVLCCDMSINKSVSSPSYMAALFSFPVSSNTSYSLILLFLLINGEMVLKNVHVRASAASLARTDCSSGKIISLFCFQCHFQI